MTDHNELAARIERAEGPELRELDLEIATELDLAPEGYERAVVWDKVQFYWWNKSDLRANYWAPPEFTASIDAAMQLIPEGWYTFLMYTDRHSGSCRWELRKRACDRAESRAATPALALCAAAIRARSAS